jgi:hypothetical protein
MPIPQEVRDYFADHLSHWSEWEENLAWREIETITYADIAARASELTHEQALELIAVAIGYVSQTVSEINIYQNALAMLQGGASEHEVDNWLAQVGFSVQHNQLGTALVQRIAQGFQNIMQVIQNFINAIAPHIPMKLGEIAFEFSVSPSVTLTFK